MLVKILIVKLGSIGDIIHTLPTLAAIRSAIPEAEVSWVVEKRSAEILRGNKMVDRLIEIDTRSLRTHKVVAEMLPRFREQFRDLRRSRFDMAIDFQGLLKSAAVAKLSGAKRRYGFARSSLREPASRVFLTHGVEVAGDVHIIRKNLKLAVNTFNIPLPEDKFTFPIFTEPRDVLEAEQIITQTGKEFAILNPAGGWVTKLWPAENFGRLADALWERHGLTSVVAVGPNETDLGAAVIGASRSGKAVLTRPSLKGFFELSKRSRVYIGGDTGPTHLAIASGAPVVGLFGPTEWWRNGSPNPDDICVERTDIGCRADCHRRTCSNWICMDINVETVAHAVKERLGKTN